MYNEFSRIKYIIGRYEYRNKSISISEMRNYKINKLLDNDTKKEQIFYGLDPYSRESLEREEVFEYYYKLGKTDEDIGKIWYDLRQKRYINII